MTRILAIMGSGETTPTMTGVHRDLLAAAAGPAVLLDTPYGFRENADDISARALEYFDRSLRTAVGVARLRSADDPALDVATAMTRVRDASWVFTGPGSPSYALRQWTRLGLAAVLAEKLERGGVVVMSSAAALTLGVSSVPVYEIYKCGEAPHWLDGLDLLSTYGLRVAVVPHFDNAEGGNHDTRFCYLGERRLQVMETLLAEGVGVLGVDEHTACVLDLHTDAFAVAGRGAVTVRAGGQEVARFETGHTGPIDVLRAAVHGERVASTVRTVTPGSDATPPVPVAAACSVLDDARACEREALDALSRRDVPGAVSALLALEGSLESWASDTSTTDERDRARAVLRGLVVRLGEVAVTGARDPRTVVGPVVEVALAARRAARERRDWSESDAIRDGLAAAGVEVRDTPAGMEWLLTEA